MPKFNEQERIRIREILFIEGEKLFSKYGLKKVTINDLTKAASISHGAFYTFFESKEHLFMEINIQIQKNIFKKLDIFISKNKDLEKKEFVKGVINFIIEEFLESAIISSIDSELWGYLSHRVPLETLNNNISADCIVIDKIIKCGIEFKVSNKLAVKLIQAILVGISAFITDEDSKNIKNILIEGLIDYIVLD